MNSSGRDSGYCENASLDFYEGTSVAILPTDTVSIKSEEKTKDCRITGPSCRALKHAVSNLTRLDDFVLEKIGNGFFSEVFKVTHRVTGDVMVLKMNLLRSNRANMLKEVQLMNQLSHPNILKFMGVCVHEGQLHALTEYINGGSLEELIQSKDELSYSTRMQLASHIAKGMSYLHSRHVFHRDLTSKNVLVQRDEESDKMTAVVGDFGLAVKIPRPGVRLPTVGSPWWMSPECLKGMYYDEKSDIFSYGILLCELIARIDADPDVLPRTSNFGLDYLAFVELCSQQPIQPPPGFLKLAFSCCNLEPKNRPSFPELVEKLDKILSPIYNRSHLLKSCFTLTEARSEEALLKQRPPSNSLTGTIQTCRNNHRKLVHRRSLSEDMGLTRYPSSTAPSDKARCHVICLQNKPLKFVGECMCQEDPHYTPSMSKSNPFESLSRFKGVRKILASTNSTDLFSSCFELPSPFYNDERKSSVYGEERKIQPEERKQWNLKNHHRTPPLVDKALNDLEIFRKNEFDNSSIIIEPTVKPSQIKKYTGTSYFPIKTTPTVNSSTSRKKENKSKNKVIRGHSLPSSPTFTRRIIVSDKCISRDEDRSSSPFTHPFYKNSTTDGLYHHTLRSCSSSCNISSLDDSSTNNIFLPVSETTTISLKRRGSCESGFYSNIGDDFCVTGMGICVGHRHTASSITLSSSSAASSLFLDSTTDDLPTPLILNNRFFQYRNTASSVYTDSSEDISSLASSEPPTLWDERQHKDRHISKIVEYFEKKQGCSTIRTGNNRQDISGRISALQPQLRRSWLHNETSLDYCTRRKLFESSTSLALPKRSVNQRLLVCEGAVKSKLPLFDKK